MTADRYSGFLQNKMLSRKNLTRSSGVVTVNTFTAEYTLIRYEPVMNSRISSERQDGRKTQAAAPACHVRKSPKEIRQDAEGLQTIRYLSYPDIHCFGCRLTLM